MKWQAPTVLQYTHIVAGGDPNAHDRMGSLSATFLRSALPVVMLALSLRSIASITTGYAEARPLGESGPKTNLTTGFRGSFPLPCLGESGPKTSPKTG